MIDCACDSLLQLPFLLGVPVLEKIAAPIAPFVVGQTGKQLFLTDGIPSDPPLLLRMASDCQEGPFMYVCSLLLGPILSRCVCVVVYSGLSVSVSLICWLWKFCSLRHQSSGVRVCSTLNSQFVCGALIWQICTSCFQVKSGVCKCQLWPYPHFVSMVESLGSCWWDEELVKRIFRRTFFCIFCCCCFIYCRFLSIVLLMEQEP